jgi:hypothetical protein
LTNNFPSRAPGRKLWVSIHSCYESFSLSNLIPSSRMTLPNSKLQKSSVIQKSHSRCTIKN